MYCGLNEAYSNNSDNNNEHLGNFDNYSDIDIQNHFNNNYKEYNNIVPSYFSAQGNITNKNGTLITDLQSEDSDSDSVMSDFSLESLSSNSSNKSDFSLFSLKSSESIHNPLPQPVEHFTINNLNTGYNIKELLIIILAGLILIFILDLLVKIGKKLH